jgi:hypothetical protein
VGGQRGTGSGFSFFPCQYHSTIAADSFIHMSLEPFRILSGMDGVIKQHTHKRLLNTLSLNRISFETRIHIHPLLLRSVLILSFHLRLVFSLSKDQNYGL